MKTSISLALALAALLSSDFAQAAGAEPAGKAVFDRICIACHQPGGVGMPGLAPALAGTLKFAASAEGKRYVAGVLTQGLSGQITSRGQVFVGAMPAQAALSDAELADVANYLASDLNGLDVAPFAAADFASARTAKASHKDLRDLRVKLLK